eukprot:gb/GEZN01006332.1/.p1 GENE.gb/GEZN01006332.1/~~gb/GEZN01006332.1/.p1  ORF type:complete len:426 (-),score=91.62 gb/GEZN01006332.1/:371-1648(-)
MSEPSKSNLYEGLDATHVQDSSKAKSPSSWDFFQDSKDVNWLNQGNTFFRFLCISGSKIQPVDQEFVDKFVNLSEYKDEVKSNGVPHVNIFEKEEASKYTLLLAKNSYLFPKVVLTDLSPELIASNDYQTHCVPGVPPTKIWGEKEYERANNRIFRLTRPLVPYLFNLTVQMQCSARRDESTLAQLSQVAGVPVKLAIVMERTKQDISHKDGTAKAKCVLMYSEVRGGVLVTMVTCVLNTTIPSVVAPWLSSFGALGVKEAAQTAVLTRRYLKEKFGLKDRQHPDDSRNQNGDKKVKTKRRSKGKKKGRISSHEQPLSNLESEFPDETLEAASNGAIDAEETDADTVYGTENQDGEIDAEKEEGEIEEDEDTDVVVARITENEDREKQAKLDSCPLSLTDATKAKKTSRKKKKKKKKAAITAQDP